MKPKSLIAFCSLGLIAFAAPASAATEISSPTTSYLLNSMWLLLCGILVMWMAAGFTMLEAGSVRAKSVVVILVKNIGLYSIAGVAFYLLGYQLMFGSSSTDLLGEFAVWQSNDLQALAGDLQSGHASNAFWFFQMVFVATAASVVSGALAERIKLWPFFAFVIILTAVIYPVVGHWTWGGGWLSQLGFSDFAGSTIVHSVGGWAALAGAILLGPRRGRFRKNGNSQLFDGSSAPQIAIGVLILWFGWFGFNGGSQLSFSTVEDAIAISNILANTNAAAAAGVIVAMSVTQILKGRPDFTWTLNGALAGLVAITAEPASPTISQSLLIGGAGSLVMLAVARILEVLRIDDVVGAVPVHLGAGIFGTLAVALTNPDAVFAAQLIGVAAVGAFVFSLSFATWFILKSSVGIRLHSLHEKHGSDATEIGMRAYNLDLHPIATQPDVALANMRIWQRRRNRSAA